MQMVSMKTQCAGIIHWDECLFWIKSSGRPLMDRHNAPAVLSLSKGGTTFFIKMTLIKLMKAWLPQESTCWRMHAFGEKMLYPWRRPEYIHYKSFVCCCVDDAHRPKKQQFDLNLSWQHMCFKNVFSRIIHYTPSYSSLFPHRHGRKDKRKR